MNAWRSRHGRTGKLGVPPHDVCLGSQQALHF
jgi:hypothetical protein